MQENIKYEFSMAILDEIVLFWKRNIGIVQLYLYNDFYNNDGYVFTAATFMDYEDDEQYPFLLLGKNTFWMIRCASILQFVVLQKIIIYQKFPKNK